MVHIIHIQYTRRKTPLDMKEEETTRNFQSFPVIAEVSAQAQRVHYLLTTETGIKSFIHTFGANTAHGHWSGWGPWKVREGRNQFAINTRQWVWRNVRLAASS